MACNLPRAIYYKIQVSGYYFGEKNVIETEQIVIQSNGRDDKYYYFFAHDFTG